MKGFIKNKGIILLLVIFGVLFTVSIVSAQEKKCGQVNWPKSPIGGTNINPSWNEKTKKCEYVSLTTLIKYLYEWGIALGGLVAFIALLIAGFQYLTSVGRPETMKEAIDRIKSAIFGLVLLLGSWLILNTINPQLTSIPPFEFDPPSKGEISPYQSCKTDADCKELEKETGQAYECQNGFCVLKPLEAKTCKEATISAGGQSKTIKKGEGCIDFYIERGSTLSAKGITPPGCRGTLELFKNKVGSLCFSGVAIVPIPVDDFSIEDTVKGIRLK